MGGRGPPGLAHLEALHDDGKGGAKEHDLSVLGMEAEELFDHWGKLGGQELVSLIHYKGLAGREVSDALAGQIENPAGGANNDVHRFAQPNDVVLQPRPAGRDHDVDAKMLSQRLAHLRCLQGELSGRDENESLRLWAFWVYALERGDDEGGRLSGAVLGSREDVAAGQGHGDGLFLDGGRLLEAGLEDAHHELALDEEVFELEALGRRDILHQQH